MKFKKALVRQPCRAMIHGLTTAGLGKPDYQKARVQHNQYIETLKQCGLQVTVLEPDEKYPDSTFVEDTALLTPACAIITNPGAPSRRGEIVEIEETVRRFYDTIEKIDSTGIVDAGDIMMVGSHYYIGLSGRTNSEGAGQIKNILEKYGMTSSTIPLRGVLHLKSGVAYLEDNNLVVSGEFIDKPEFRDFNRIIVDKNEAYAANCLWLNGTVLLAGGFPKIKAKIEAVGYRTLELDISEFQKLDGGLSCLSLRF